MNERNMIAKEKHFAKCETPNGSRIVDDKMVNNAQKAVADGAKQPEEPDNKAVTPTVAEAPKVAEDRQAPPMPNGDDASSTGQKVGTVIPNRIFVGGFPPKTADEDLWKFFATIANITAAKIIYDRSGVSKCYGFVTFANPKDAKQIVKQTGGTMLSPMGRLRISQAVRKQVPHYSPEYAHLPMPVDASMNGGGGGYYINPPCPSSAKPPSAVCLAYPMQAVHHHHHVSTIQHAPPSGPPQQQQPQQPLPSMQQNHHQQQQPQSGRPRSAPSTSPRSSTAGSSESGGSGGGGGGGGQQQQHHQQPQQQHIPNYHESIYQGAMMAAGPPTYVIPSMGIPYAPSLPAYDATGLYTTCPGYAQPMAAYPYAVVLPPPPRDGGAAASYAASYGPAPLAAYMPQPPAACYVRDAGGKAPAHHLPIMNSYIY